MQTPAEVEGFGRHIEVLDSSQVHGCGRGVTVPQHTRPSAEIRRPPSYAPPQRAEPLVTSAVKARRSLLEEGTDRFLVISGLLGDRLEDRSHLEDGIQP